VGLAIKWDSESTNLGPRAVRWDTFGTAVTELGHLSPYEGYKQSAASAINGAGTAVGWTSKINAASAAVRWDASSTAATELSYPAPATGSLWSKATAINDAGTVVGYAYIFDGFLQGGDAVRWDASGAAVQLQTPTSNLGEFTRGVPHAINAAGTAVGVVEEYEYFSDETGTITFLVGSRALRWDATTTSATVLGNLGENPNGIPDSNAFAINAAGFAVGYATGPRAVYWGSDGVAVDLNTLVNPNGGWLLTQAFSISDTGWIAGVGKFDPDGLGGQAAYSRHFLMQVPATAVIPGDFNSNGAVDAADYVVWRKGLGTTYTQDHYNIWRAHFGEMAASGAALPSAEPLSAAVPEPAGALLFLVFGATVGIRPESRLVSRIPSIH
jgi:hypothetical protein